MSEDGDLRGFLEQAEPNDTLARWELLRTVERGLFGGPEEPLTVGRYRLVSRIGTGGQGTVYVAHDPELGRDVAIKVVRSDRRSPDARARLLREAAALAQLSHPNVVAVNDVGECEAGVYVVTALVPGVTLARWLDVPRSWEAVVATFVAAGSGLVAAHARRIVHRDFKPANVIISDDGGVQLLDFGLARALGDEDSADNAGTISGQALSDSATATGTVMGTPVYMAPEQHLGEIAGAAADQYAFCVALFEALTRRRPFFAETLAELVVAKQSRRPLPWPRVPAVPGALRRLVERGLAPEPADRWASMADVVERLQRLVRPGRSRLAAAVAVGATLIGVGAVAVVLVDPQRTPDCADPAVLAATWSAERAAGLTAAFVATDRPIAADAAARVTARLDAYGEAWMAARVEACAAVQADPAADARIACLERARVALDGTLRVLETADAEVVLHANDIVAGLTPPERCSGSQRAATDPAIAGAVAEARADLAHARALMSAGRHADAAAEIETIVATATSLDDPALVGEARLAQAAMLRATSAFDEAAVVLEQVYLVAEADRDDQGAFASALELAQIHGVEKEDTAQGTTWLRRSEAALARLGAAIDPVQEGELARASSDIAKFGGDLPAAIEHGRRAVERLETELGPADARVARALRSLAIALVKAGQIEEAQQIARRALEVAEAAVGPDHPETASSLRVVGWSLRHSGDLDESLELARRAYALFENALGPDSPQLATTLENIAVLHSEMGHPLEAEAAYRRVLEIYGKTMKPGDPAFARALHNLAITLRDLGRVDEAIAAWREAIAIAQASIGPDHIETAMFETIFAGYLADQKHQAEGLEMITHALDVLRKAAGEEHPRTLMAWGVLGHVQRRADDLEAAQVSIERAVAIGQVVYGPGHVEVGRLLHELANLRGDQGDPKAAIAIHERAIAIIEASLGPGHTTVAEMLTDLASKHDTLKQPEMAANARARAAAIRTAAGVVPPH